VAQNSSGMNAREVMILTSIRDSFEAALARGEDWSIESRLELVADRMRSELLRELLQCELAARNGSGPPQIDDYLRRFPDSEDIVRAAFESQPEASATAPGSKPDDSNSASALDATRVFDREALNLEAGQKSDSTPDRIDRYVIEETLGHGGMGVVYRARDAELKRSVALKIILMAGHAGEVQRQRFRTEAEAVAAPEHCSGFCAGKS
jgi:hypothetical protein